jgi:hypothetical protein
MFGEKAPQTRTGAKRRASTVPSVRGSLLTSGDHDRVVFSCLVLLRSAAEIRSVQLAVGRAKEAKANPEHLENLTVPHPMGYISLDN